MINRKVKIRLVESLIFFNFLERAETWTVRRSERAGTLNIWNYDVGVE